MATTIEQFSSRRSSLDYDSMKPPRRGPQQIDRFVKIVQTCVTGLDDQQDAISGGSQIAHQTIC